jgi:molybdopterin synthase catalytic subunit
VRHLSSTPISPEAVTAGLAADADGAVVTFVGLVRDHHAGKPVVALGYSAYEVMAEAATAAIVAEARARWPVRLAVVHRLGELVIGDVAIVVAAAGAHRAESFAAASWVVDEVKRRVPIWKRERYADGSEAWVDPTAPDGIVPVQG